LIETSQTWAPSKIFKLNVHEITWVEVVQEYFVPNEHEATQIKEI
jgi:hypothetical protein